MGWHDQRCRLVRSSALLDEVKKWMFALSCSHARSELLVVSSLQCLSPLAGSSRDRLEAERLKELESLRLGGLWEGWNQMGTSGVVIL